MADSQSSLGFMDRTSVDWTSMDRTSMNEKRI